MKIIRIIIMYYQNYSSLSKCIIEKFILQNAMQIIRKPCEVVYLRKVLEGKEQTLFIFVSIAGTQYMFVNGYILYHNFNHLFLHFYV